MRTLWAKKVLKKASHDGMTFFSPTSRQALSARYPVTQTRFVPSVFIVPPAFQHHSMHSLNKMSTQDSSEIDFNNYTINSAVNKFNNSLSIRPYALNKSKVILGGVMKKYEMERSKSLGSIIEDKSYNLPENRAFLNDLTPSLREKLHSQLQQALSNDNQFDEFITPNLDQNPKPQFRPPLLKIRSLSLGNLSRNSENIITFDEIRENNQKETLDEMQQLAELSLEVKINEIVIPAMEQLFNIIADDANDEDDAQFFNTSKENMLRQFAEKSLIEKIEYLPKLVEQINKIKPGWSTITILKHQHADAEKRRKTLEDELKQSEQHIQQLMREQQNSTQNAFSIEDLQFSKQRLIHDLNALNNTIRTLDYRIFELEKENYALKNEIITNTRQFETEKSKVVRDFNDVTALYDDVLNELAIAQRKTEQIEAAKYELEEENKYIKDNVSEFYQQQSKEHQDKLDLVQIQLTESINDYLEMTSSLEDQQQLLLERNEFLATAFHELQLEKTKLEERLGKLDADLNQAKETADIYSGYAKENETLSSQNAKYKDRLDNTKNELNTTKRELELAKQHSQKVNVSELYNQVNLHLKEKNDLQAKLAELTTIADEFFKDMDTNNPTLNDVKKFIGSQKDKLAHVDESIAKIEFLTGENDNLNQNIKALTQDLNNTNRDLLQKTRELEQVSIDLEKANVSLDNSVKNALLVREEIEKHNQRHENECMLLEDTLNKAITKGKTAEGEVASLRAQMTALNEQYETATEELNIKLANIEQQRNNTQIVVEDFEQNLKLKKEENEELKLIMYELSAENSRLTTMISQFSVYEDQPDRMKTLKKQLKQANMTELTVKSNFRRLNGALNRAKNSILDLKSTLNSLKHQRDQARIENGQLNFKLLDLETEVRALQESSDKSKIALHEQQQLTQHANQAVKDLQNTLESEMSYYVHAQQKIADLNAGHELAKNALLKSNESQETLRHRLIELDEKHRLQTAQLESDLAGSKALLNALESNLANSQEEYKAANQILSIEIVELKNKAEQSDALRKSLTDENLSLSNQLQQLVDNNSKLSLELKEKRRINNDLLESVTFQTSRIEYYQDRFFTLMRDNKQRQEQNTDFAQQIQALQGLNNSLTSKVTDLERQVKFVESELDNTKNALLWHKNNTAESANAIKTLKLELDTETSLANGAHLKLASLTLDYEKQQEQLNVSKLDVDVLTAALKKLDETYQFNKNKLQEQLETSQMGLEDAHIRLDKMQLALHDSTTAVSQLQLALEAQASAAETVKQRLVDQNNSLNKQLLQLGDQNQGLARELTEKQDINAHLQKSLEQETKQANFYFGECIKQRKENQLIAEDNTTLTLRIKTQQLKLDTFLSQTTRLETQVNQLTKAIEDKNLECHQYQYQLKQANKEISKLNGVLERETMLAHDILRKHTSLSKDYEEQKQSLLLSNLKKEELNTKLDALNENYTREKLYLDYQLAKSEEKLFNANDRLALTERQLEDSKAAVNNLQGELATQLNRSLELVERLNEQEGENHNLRDQLQRNEQQISEMSDQLEILVDANHDLFRLSQELATQLAEQKQQNNHLQFEVNDLKIQVDLLEQYVENENIRFVWHKNEVENSIEKINSLNEQLGREITNSETAREALEDLTKAYQEQKLELEQSNREQDELTDMLEDLISIYEDDKANLQNQLLTSQLHTNIIQERLSHAEHDLADSRANAAQLQKQMQANYEQFDVLQQRLIEENAELRTDINKFTDINNEITQQLTAKLQENEQLQKVLSDKSILVDSYSHYCDELITREFKLNEKNNALVQRVQQQALQNEHLLNHIAGQDEHIGQLEQEIAQLHAQLSQNLNPFLNPIVDHEMQRLQRQVTELQQRNRDLEMASFQSMSDDDDFDEHFDDDLNDHQNDEFNTDDGFDTDDDDNNHEINSRVLNNNNQKRVDARSRPLQENERIQRRTNTDPNSDLDRNSLFNRSKKAGKKVRFSLSNEFQYRLMDKAVFQQAIEEHNITSRMDAHTHDINHHIQANQVLVGTKEYVNGRGDVEGTACLAVHHDGLIEDWSHGDALDDDEIALEMATLVIEKYKKGDSVDIGGTDRAQIQRVTAAIHQLKNELLDYQLIYDEDNSHNPEPNTYVLSEEGLLFYDHQGEPTNIYINEDEVAPLRDIFNQSNRKADFNDLKRITEIINFSVPYQDIGDIRTNPAPTRSQLPHINTQNIRDYKEKLWNLKASAEASSTDNARFSPNGQ